MRIDSLKDPWNSRTSCNLRSANKNRKIHKDFIARNATCVNPWVNDDVPGVPYVAQVGYWAVCECPAAWNGDAGDEYGDGKQVAFALQAGFNPLDDVNVEYAYEEGLQNDEAEFMYGVAAVLDDPQL